MRTWRPIVDRKRAASRRPLHSRAPPDQSVKMSRARVDQICFCPQIYLHTLLAGRGRCVVWERSDSCSSKKLSEGFLKLPQFRFASAHPACWLRVAPRVNASSRTRAPYPASYCSATWTRTAAVSSSGSRMRITCWRFEAIARTSRLQIVSKLD